MLGVVLTLTALSLFASQPADPAAPTSPGDADKILYSMGLALAGRLGPLELSDANVKSIQEGLADGLSGRPPRTDMSQWGPRIDGFLRERREAAVVRTRAEGKAFMEKTAGETGARNLESGLIYFELQAGAGPSPGPTDRVKVKYSGTFPDGRTFDTSGDESVEFALNAVVACFSEGLQLMKVGGRARLVCPPDLAYGDRGSPPVGPGATLIFQVELMEIPGGAPTE